LVSKISFKFNLNRYSVEYRARAKTDGAQTTFTELSYEIGEKWRWGCTS
jgi:hypothetical protein